MNTLAAATGPHRVPGAAAVRPAEGPPAPPPPGRVRDMTTAQLGRAGEELAASHGTGGVTLAAIESILKENIAPEYLAPG